MKRLAWLSSLLLMGACAPAPDGMNKEGAPTALARLTTLEIPVKASGEIRALKSATIIPELKTAATLEYIVDEGSRVTNGQVVARLNTEEIVTTIRTLEDKIAEQNTKLSGLETDVIIQRLANDKDLKTAQQTVASSKLELEKLLEGDVPLERRTAELLVQTTERERDLLTRRVSDIKRLLSDGFVTADQVEEEEIAHEKAIVAAETAKEELVILNEYSIPLREEKARNALSAAQTELEKTLKSNAARLAQKEQAVASARRALEKMEEELGDRREQLTACTVIATADGIVIYAGQGRRYRRSEIQVGGRLSPGQTLMTIPDVSKMQAVINVSEADIRKLALEQAATVTVEATGGSTFMGTIKKIAEVANTGGFWGSDVKEFSVEIELDDGAVLKPGYSCEADIMTRRIENVLCVPIQAVFQEEDRLFVYALRDKTPERVTVSLGPSSLTQVQVLEGLADGDRILLSEPVVKRSDL